MPTLILVCLLRGNCVLTLEDGGQARRSNTLPTRCRIPKPGAAIVRCHRDSEPGQQNDGDDQLTTLHAQIAFDQQGAYTFTVVKRQLQQNAGEFAPRCNEFLRMSPSAVHV